MKSVPREAVESVARTVRQTLVFSGRSRIRDVLYFWAVAGLLAMAANAAVQASLRWDAAIMARIGVDLFLTMPYFALFVRRLHDQDRSGWWVLILPPLLAFNIYETIHVSFHPLDPDWEQSHAHALLQWGWVLLPLAAVSVVFIFVGGTIGPNRYGPDPRERAAVASAT